MNQEKEIISNHYHVAVNSFLENATKKIALLLPADIHSCRRSVEALAKENKAFNVVNVDFLGRVQTNLDDICSTSKESQLTLIIIRGIFDHITLDRFREWLDGHRAGVKCARLKIIVVAQKCDLYLLQEDYRESFVPVVEEVYREDWLEEIEEPVLSQEEIERELQGGDANAEEYLIYLKEIPGLRDVLSQRHFLNIYKEKLSEWIVTLKERGLELVSGEKVKSKCVRYICKVLIESWYQQIVEGCVGRDKESRAVQIKEQLKDYRELSEELAGVVRDFGKDKKGLTREQLIECVGLSKDPDYVRRCLQGIPLMLVAADSEKFEFRFLGDLLLNYCTSLRRKRSRLRLFDKPLKLINEKNQESEWLEDRFNSNLLGADELRAYAERLHVTGSDAVVLRTKMLGWVYRSSSGERYSVGGRNGITILNYSGYNFSGQEFVGIHASYADLSEGLLQKADFQGATLRQLKLRNADCTDAIFTGAELGDLDIGLYPGLPNHGKISRMKWDRIHHRLYCTTEISHRRYGIQVLSLEDIYSEKLPDSSFWSSMQEIEAIDFNCESDELIYVTATNINRLKNCSTKNENRILNAVKDMFEAEDSTIALRISSDSKVLAVATSSTVNIYNNSTKDSDSRELYGQTIVDIAVSHDSRYLCAVTDLGNVTVFIVPQLDIYHSYELGLYDNCQVEFFKDEHRIGVLSSGIGENSERSFFFIIDLTNRETKKVALASEPIRFCIPESQSQVFVIYYDNIVEGIDILTGAVFYRNKINQSRDFCLSDIVCLTQNDLNVLLVSSSSGVIHRLITEEKQYRNREKLSSYTIAFIPKVGLLASLKTRNGQNTPYVSLVQLSDGREMRAFALDFKAECLTYDFLENRLIVGGEAIGYSNVRYHDYFLKLKRGLTEDQENTFSSGLIRYIPLSNINSTPIPDISFKVSVKCVALNDQSAMALVTRENILWTRLPHQKDFIRYHPKDMINIILFDTSSSLILIGLNKGIGLYDMSINKTIDYFSTHCSVLSIILGLERHEYVINSAPKSLISASNSFSVINILNKKLFIKGIFHHTSHHEIRAVAVDHGNALIISGDNYGKIYFWNKSRGIIRDYKSHKLYDQTSIIYSMERDFGSIESLLVVDDRLIVYDNSEESITVWKIINNTTGVTLTIVWTSRQPTLRLEAADFRGAKGLNRNNRAVLSQFFAKVDLAEPEMPLHQYPISYDSDHDKELVNDYMQAQIRKDSDDDGQDHWVQSTRHNVDLFSHEIDDEQEAIRDFYRNQLLQEEQGTSQQDIDDDSIDERQNEEDNSSSSHSL